jgi:L-fucose isomerase-like protein
VVKRSLRELGAAAKQISDGEAQQAWQSMAVPAEGVSQRAALSAAKLYLAVRRDLDADPAIRAAGMNCLNESHFSDTTPCLAWNALFEERGLVWGCEADTLSMITEYVLHKTLDAPVMMTNLYPFVLGGAALKHERIDRFPAVGSEPENHVLVAHCGYAGLIPRRFSTEWTLRAKVLAIVDQNATAIDARLPEGPVTLAKLHPSMDKLSVAEAELTGYAQFPGSDCLNGGVVRVRDGHRLMRGLASHHYVLLTGHHATDIRFLGKVFGLAIEEI